jgi:phosphatidylglycerol:prolipoprotein diacylglycerol transferase
LVIAEPGTRDLPIEGPDRRPGPQSLPPDRFDAVMLPNLIFGAFVFAALAAGVVTVRHEARSFGAGRDELFDLCTWILVAAMIGARVFYILANPQSFADDPMEALRIWNGGLVYAGGVVSALAVAVAFVKKARLACWQTADTLAPGLAIGHFLGWMGCYASGLCLSASTGVYEKLSAMLMNRVLPAGMFAHTTALHLSMSYLVIFIVLCLFKRHRHFEGQLFWSFVMLHGLVSLLLGVSPLAGVGPDRYGPFPAYEVVGFGWFLAAAVMCGALWRKSVKRNQPSAAGGRSPAGTHR